MNFPENNSKKPVDIDQLVKEHANDPKLGQGFNDQRGDFPDTDENNPYKNLKNNLGPEQKKKREPHIGVVQVPDQTNPNKKSNP